MNFKSALNALRNVFSNRENHPVILITLISIFLNTFDLGDLYFWMDEVETLVLGQFTLHWGYPRIFDEHYQFCSTWGVAPGDIYVFHSWLQYYITAASIFLFKDSVALIRLPFALLGAFCVPLLWCIGKRLSLKREALIISCLLLATSIPFIFWNRNIRYYPLAHFFTLVLLLFYLDIVSENYKRWIWLGIGSVFFIHSMAPICFAVVLTLGIHALIFHRKREVLFALLKSQILTLIFYLPFFLYSWPAIVKLRGEYHGAILGKGLGGVDFFVGLGLHLTFLIKFCFPFLLFPVALVIFWRKKKDLPKISPLILLFLVVLQICAMMAFTNNHQLPPAYISAAIPPLILLAGILIQYVSGKNIWLMVFLTGVVMFSNILNLPPWLTQKPRVSDRKAYYTAKLSVRRQILKENLTLNRYNFLLAEYLFWEWTTDYEGPMEGVVKFLKSHAKAGQTFFSTRDQHTLHFATGLTRIDSTPFQSPPDWLIWRLRASWSDGVCWDPKKDHRKIHNYVVNFIKNNPYEIILLDYPDFSHENMPILQFLLGWPREIPEHTKGVMIFRYRGRSSKETKK